MGRTATPTPSKSRTGTPTSSTTISPTASRTPLPFCAIAGPEGLGSTVCIDNNLIPWWPWPLLLLCCCLCLAVLIGYLCRDDSVRNPRAPGQYHPAADDEDPGIRLQIARFDHLSPPPPPFVSPPRTDVSLIPDPQPETEVTVRPVSPDETEIGVHTIPDPDKTE